MKNPHIILKMARTRAVATILPNRRRNHPARAGVSVSADDRIVPVTPDEIEADPVQARARLAAIKLATCQPMTADDWDVLHFVSWTETHELEPITNPLEN